MENKKIVFQTIDYLITQSEYTDDFFNKPPVWITRFGTSIIAFVLLAICSFFLFLKYPVFSDAKLTYEINKGVVVLKIPKNSQVEFLQKNGQRVSIGDDLLLRKIGSNYEQITNLRRMLVRNPISDTRLESIILPNPDSLRLGEITPYYVKYFYERNQTNYAELLSVLYDWEQQNITKASIQGIFFLRDSVLPASSDDIVGFLVPDSMALYSKCIFFDSKYAESLPDSKKVKFVFKNVFQIAEIIEVKQIEESKKLKIVLSNDSTINYFLESDTSNIQFYHEKMSFFARVFTFNK